MKFDNHISRPAAGSWNPWAAAIALSFLLAGCGSFPGKMAGRKGDEIVAAGRFIHTGTPVVLWLDPGGYDAYRVERRFASWAEADWDNSREKVTALKKPNRFGLRESVLTPEQIQQVRGGGWDLPLLQDVVDQFVIHFDDAGTSRQCFKILHDIRDLSVHFMLDLDGTIYQTLDLKERAWHATTSNSRSIGIEIANIGAHPLKGRDPFAAWFRQDPEGKTTITIPKSYEPSGIRTPGFVGHPARPAPVTGKVQGENLRQYDFTPEQYQALVKLTAALCKTFPKLTCDYPRDSEGKLLLKKLPDDELKNYHGVLGHFHVQTNKVDPGPAFQWDYVLENARRLLKKQRHGAEDLRPSGSAVKLQRAN